MVHLILASFFSLSLPLLSSDIGENLISHIDNDLLNAVIVSKLPVKAQLDLSCTCKELKSKVKFSLNRLNINDANLMIIANPRTTQKIYTINELLIKLSEHYCDGNISQLVALPIKQVLFKMESKNSTRPTETIDPKCSPEDSAALKYIESTREQITLDPIFVSDPEFNPRRELSPEIIKRMLKNNYIESIFIEDIRVNATVFSDALLQNTTLTSLSLRYVGLMTFTNIFDSINTHAKIKYLDLSDNNFSGDNLTSLPENTTLEDLSLQHCSLQDNAVNALCKFIKTRGSLLKSIHLDLNSFSKEAIETLTQQGLLSKVSI